MRLLPAPSLLLFALCATCAALGAMHSPARAAYTLDWSSLAGGGQSAASGGAYALSSTTGQAFAGPLEGGAYAITSGFWSGSSVATTGVGDSHDALPRVFAARLAGANPSHGATALQFDLPAPRRVTVTLFGVDGRVVRRLLDGPREAGRHTAYWDGLGNDGRPVLPGMYFARVAAGDSRATLRIVRIH